MRAGAAELDAWLVDRFRRGVGTLESERDALEDRARRLVDAQLPGLARWLRFVEARVAEGPGWPGVAVGELARMGLVARALVRYDELDDARRADVLLRAGWTIRSDDVARDGARARARWWVVGHELREDDTGLATRRTWLVGPGDAGALVLAHAFGGAPLPRELPTGRVVDATLAFWPGSWRQRATIVAEHEVDDGPPPAVDVGVAGARLAAALAVDPLLTDIPVVVAGRIVPYERGWAVRDDVGRGLPLAGAASDGPLAALRGASVAVAGAFGGRSLRPVTVFVDDEAVAVAAPVDPPRARVAVDGRLRGAVLGADRVGEDPEALLWRAAVRSVQERAAADPIEVPAPPDAAPADPRRPCPAPLARLFEEVLTRRPELLPELVDAAAPFRPTSTLIPRLLGAPEPAHPALRGWLGPAAVAAASARVGWRWAAPPTLDEAGDDAILRPLALARAFDEAPDAARAWLRAHHRLGAADARAAVWRVAAPRIGLDDEDLLEAALDDRAGAVREIVAERLIDLVGSAFADRRREAARSAFRDGQPELPTSLSAALRRDGLDDDLSTPSGRQRAWRRLVSSVPPSAWGPPGSSVDLDDPRVVLALGTAAARFGDVGWCAAVVDRVADAPGGEFLWARLVVHLPDADARLAAVWTRPDDRLVPAVLAWPAWSAAVSDAFLAGVRGALERDGVETPCSDAWIEALPLAAARAHRSGLAAWAEPLPRLAASTAGARRWVVAARDLADIVSLRRKMATFAQLTRN